MYLESSDLAEIFLTVTLSVMAVIPNTGHADSIKHPVLDHGIDRDKAASYERAVERVMAMSEEDMLSFVPDRPFCQFCYCPNCHGGSQGSGIYNWSIDRPDELVCRYCGTVYPNDQYPDDQIVEGKNALGETFTYRYHQDRKREDLKIFIQAHILMYKRGWVLSQCQALGRAYQATGKPEYARKAILILDRVAQVYPHYPMMRQWITTFEFGPQEPPYPGAGGKWGRWMSSELPFGVIESYDLVCDSDEFDKLSKIRGYDVREKLESDFFRGTMDYMRTFQRHDNNMSPSYLRVAAKIGRVINEPEYVHWSYRWLLEILMGGFFYDGMWHEAPSYHYQVIGGLNAGFSELRGYSDPTGYIDEVHGSRFDNLKPDKDIAFLAKAKNAPATVGWPSGIVSAIHDTWANSVRSKPRDETVSTICPGYGHASLGRGAGADQMQAQLHFSGGYGHTHLDNLNLSLFAKEREMLCDVGYTHTRLRNWSVGTVGHNLVVVDRQGQTGQNSDGDLLAFVTDAKGVSVVEADGKRAYANLEGIDTYRRMLVMIPVSDENAYVVDLFRVKGGSIHDWLVHGSANHDMTAECSVRMSGSRENMLEPGEEWEEPKTEGSSFNNYGVIREVKEGKTSGNIVTKFTYADQPDKGVRIHIPGNGETEVYLGKSPSVRKAGSDSNKVYDHWMPQFIARRRGETPLQSIFAAVEEPFDGDPFIDVVEQVGLEPDGGGSVALRVVRGDAVDTIISTLDEPPYTERITANGIRIRGRLGIVRQVNGKTVGMWLFGGEKLAASDAALEPETGFYNGKIQAAMRKADDDEQDAFITDANLPSGNALRGKWMIVTHGNGYRHGYEIDSVKEHEGKRMIILTDDHGLRIDGEKTKEVYFPRREIKGGNVFTIMLSANL